VKRKQYVEALALAQSLSDGTAKGTTDFVGSGAKRKDLVAEQVVARSLYILIFSNFAA
jgi:hypothetical protein